jgi:hypothetical protein
LVLDLVEAAPDDAEKKKLAALNERLLRGGVQAPRPASPRPPASAPNS